MIGWENLWQKEEVTQWWSAMPPLPEVVEMADRLAQAGRRCILDIGCGMGRHTLYLAKQGFAVTATDNAPTALQNCGSYLEKAGLQAKLLELEMTEFPFADNSFDGIIASLVIHHTNFAVLKQIIDNIWAKLAPGGYFVWAMPNPRHACCGVGEEIEPGTWVDPNHDEGPIPHHYCTEAEVRKLLKSFGIESFTEFESVREDKTYCHWRVLAQKAP